jgi:protein-tyrosine-phosphatase
MALSVAVFVVFPALVAVLIRWVLTPSQLAATERWLQLASMGALVLVIVIIFVYQGATLVKRVGAIALTAVPLGIQTVLIFGIAYAVLYYVRVPFSLAAPGAMIASSNFFELAVAVALTAYGPDSPATLATVVGVLEEVPIMLALCWFCLKTKPYFDARAPPRRVLFVCKANRCRSILAEGLMRHELGLGSHVIVASAGAKPSAAGPHPLALQVLAEAGVSASAAENAENAFHSKALTGEEVGAFAPYDLICTVCAENDCPNVQDTLLAPGGVFVHHEFPDPDRPVPAADPEEDLNRFRATRDAVQAWVRELVAQHKLKEWGLGLAPLPPPPPPATAHSS